MSKTEKQKMLAGELYRPGDPELQADAAANKAWLARYNAALAAPVAERHALLSAHFGRVGTSAVIRPPFFCDYGYNIGLGDEVFLSFLPLSHSYEHTAGMMFPISLGAQIYFAEGAETLAANMLEARPTIMTAVPRLYETLHQRIRLGVERRGGVSRKLFDKAVAIGRKRASAQPMSPGERLLDPVLDRLVRAKCAAASAGGSRRWSRAARL